MFSLTYLLLGMFNAAVFSTAITQVAYEKEHEAILKECHKEVWTIRPQEKPKVKYRIGDL